MTTSSTDQNSKENVQAGQFHPSHQYKPQQQSQNDHQSQPDRFTHMSNNNNNSNYPGSAINQNNSHQGGNNHTSSENKLEIPGMGTSSTTAAATTAQIAPSGNNPNNHGDTTSSMIANSSGDSMGQDAPKHPNSTATAPSHPQNSSDPSRRSGPRPEGLRNDKGGSERKIGRGTSWRRDHDARGDQELTPRGRGRGASSRSRGYRNNHSDYDSREYYSRRGNDRRAPYAPRPPPPPPLSNLSPSAPHPSLDPRGPPYPPPDPYYDSRGAYPPSPPIYDARRDYPTDPARYFDDYHRGGYDPRDVPPPLPRAPPSPLPPPNQAIESGRPYDRVPLPGRDDPSEYGRSYSRPRDPRDEYRGDPRDADPRLRDVRDPRYMDEGRNARRFDDPRMLPPPPAVPADRRPPPRDPMDYRDEGMNHNRRPSIDNRAYGRVVSRDVDPSIKSESPSNIQKPPETSSPIDAKKIKDDSGARDNLNNGAGIPPSARQSSRPPPAGPPPPPAMDPKHQAPYGYDRERPPPPDRYREPDDYGRGGPYSPFEGRGEGRGGARVGGSARDSDPRDLRDPHAYDKLRDPRDPYYANYPAAGGPPPPTSEYTSGAGGREPYPPRAAPPPLDYPRGPPPPAAYDERYPPPRGPPMDLEPPASRGREGYRDLPPRPLDYGLKRKYDPPEYSDPYDDYRGREPRYPPERPVDYPPRPYDYDDRDPKRVRGPPTDPRDIPYGRPPPFDDRGPPPPPEFERPYPPYRGPNNREFPRRERIRPHGRYFLVKTSTAENIAQSRETGRWGVPVKDVEILREAYKQGDVTFLFALDESGRYSGYAQMTSEVGSVPPMTWMEEHCTPVGAAFEVKHRTTDDVRTTTTTKIRNFLTEGKPVRFGRDGQEISPKEAQILVDELERMSGPENAEKRANAVVSRGIPRGRGRGGRGTSGYSPTYRGYHYDGPRGRGRGRGRDT